MLITFKSRASGDVIMFGDNARQMLKILGKDPEDAKGIVTTAQLPGAIASLKAAIEADKQREHGGEENEEEDDDAPAGGGQGVSLAQRAYPLLELLEYSQKEDVPVTWGV